MLGQDAVGLPRTCKLRAVPKGSPKSTAMPTSQGLETGFTLSGARTPSMLRPAYVIKFRRGGTEAALMRCGLADGRHFSLLFRIDDIKVLSPGRAVPIEAFPFPRCRAFDSIMAHRTEVGEVAVEERP
jgi:hypothetical protein